MTGTVSGAALRLALQRESAAEDGQLRFHRMAKVRGGHRCRDCGVEKIAGGWYRNGTRLERRPQCVKEGK
jgi:hypothetical protein